MQKILSQIFKRKNLQYFAFLPFVAFITYYLWRIRDFYFRSDDFHHLIKNKNLNIFEIFSYKYQYLSNANLYRPTTNIFYLTNEHFFGYNVAIYTLEMVVLATVIFYFAYKIFKYFQKDTIISALFASIFLLSPAMIEPITWYSNICDTFGLVFGLSSIIFYLEKEKNKYYKYLSGFLLLLGFLSKEAVLCLIPFFIIVEIFSDKDAGQKLLKLKNLLIIIIPGAIYGFIRLGYTNYIRINNLAVNYVAPSLGHYSLYLNNIASLIKRMFLIPDNLSLRKYYLIGLLTLAIIALIPMIFLKKYKGEYLGSLAIIGTSLMINMSVPVIFDRYVIFTLFGILMAITIVSVQCKRYYKVFIPLLLFGLLSVGIIFVYRFEGVRRASLEEKKFLSSISNQAGPLKDVPYALTQTFIIGKYSINYYNLMFSELIHVKDACDIYKKTDCNVSQSSNKIIEQKIILIK